MTDVDPQKWQAYLALVISSCTLYKNLNQLSCLIRTTAFPLRTLAHKLIQSRLHGKGSHNSMKQFWDPWQLNCLQIVILTLILSSYCTMMKSFPPYLHIAYWSGSNSSSCKSKLFFLNNELYLPFQILSIFQHKVIQKCLAHAWCIRGGIFTLYIAFCQLWIDHCWPYPSQRLEKYDLHPSNSFLWKRKVFFDIDHQTYISNTMVSSLGSYSCLFWESVRFVWPYTHLCMYLLCYFLCVHSLFRVIHSTWSIFCLSWSPLIKLIKLNFFSLQGRCIEGAVWFSILLHLKHINIYLAPAFFVYLLRNYCFRSSKCLWSIKILNNPLEKSFKHSF